MRVCIRFATLVRAPVFLFGRIVLVSRFVLGVWVWIGRQMFLVQLLPSCGNCDRALKCRMFLESVRLLYNESRNRVANISYTR